MRKWENVRNKGALGGMGDDKKLYSSDTKGKQGKFWSVEKKKEKRKK